MKTIKRLKALGLAASVLTAYAFTWPLTIPTSAPFAKGELGIHTAR